MVGFSSQIPCVMWMIYALAASLCWGASYAACGPVLKRGVGPLVFFFGYSLLGTIGAALVLAASGKLLPAFKLEGLGEGDRVWFLFSIAGSALGAFLTYAAMSAKNPTLAAMVEISYPIFVVMFTWIFFREFQLNTTTLLGAALILVGVVVLTLGEHR